MTWAKLDDHFPVHRKIRPLSDAAFRLHVSAICWASAHLTDGVIPADELQLVADVRNAKRAADELVARRVWVVIDAGWQIHDFTIYNPTAEKVAGIKAKRAEAGRRGGQAKGKQSAYQDDEQPPEQDAGQLGNPVPSPVVVLTSESQSQLSDAHDKPDDLDLIIEVLAGLRPGRTVDRAWAAKVRADIGSRMVDVRNPAAYIRAALEAEPDRYLPAAVPNGLQANLHGPGTSDLARAADHARDALRAQCDANRAEVPG